MEKTLIFHIGTPKTGTTSIQSFLKSNKYILETHGMCYPDTNKFCKDYGIDIGTAINNVQNGGFFEHFIPLGIDKINMKQLLQNMDFMKILGYILLQFKQYDKVILSDESMWLRDITELLQYFQEKKIRVKVVVYFRNQIDYIESFWKHDIKMGLFTGHFSEFWEQRKKTNVIYSMYYYKKLYTIEKVISKQNIMARLYNPNQHKEEDNWLIKDFFNVLGFSLDLKYYIEQKYENVSLFGSALILKNKFNELGIEDLKGNFRQLYIQMSKQLVAENPQIRNTTFITRELIKSIHQEFLEENNMLKQEYFTYVQGPLFDAFSKKIIKEQISDFDKEIFWLINIYMQKEMEFLASMSKQIDEIKENIEN